MTMKHLVRLTFQACMTLTVLSTALCQAAESPAWVRSVRSGSWSDAGTWSGNAVPAAGARVHIATGMTVLYDVRSEATLRAVYVSGTLSFAPDKNTQLNVGVLKVEPGDRPSEEGFDCEAHLTEPE